MKGLGVVWYVRELTSWLRAILKVEEASWLLDCEARSAVKSFVVLREGMLSIWEMWRLWEGGGDGIAASGMSIRS